MFHYDMENRGKMSIYEYLYYCIREDILKDKIHIGDKLPSKRILAKELGISITSVESAYSQLMLEGYIRSVHGSGFFVNKTVDPVYDLPALPSKKIAEKKPKVSIFETENSAAEILTSQLSTIDKAEDYVLDFKANRSSVEHFPFSTWSKVMRSVLSERNAEILGTVPFNGLYELRKALSEYLYKHRGIDADPRQIIIGAGTEYLYARLLQVFGYNTVIAIEDPGYKKFSDISSHQGVVWDYIPMDEDGMQTELLRRSSANVIHVSPSNHFPTGIVMSVSRRNELLEWAGERQERYIIEDDYDSELRYSGKVSPTMYSLDQNQKVIYMNTFSKSLVPSIRISYMILPPYLLERYEDTLSFYSCTVSAFEQLTLAHFIAQGYFSRHINRMKQIYKERRDLMLAALEESRLHNISEIREANAGTHFLLHVNTALTDKQIKRKAGQLKIELALLSDYTHYQSLKTMGTLIINYAGLEKNQIIQAIHIFEEIFKTDLEK